MNKSNKTKTRICSALFIFLIVQDLFQPEVIVFVKIFKNKNIVVS